MLPAQGNVKMGGISLAPKAVGAACVPQIRVNASEREIREFSPNAPMYSIISLSYPVTNPELLSGEGFGGRQQSALPNALRQFGRTVPRGFQAEPGPIVGEPLATRALA